MIATSKVVQRNIKQMTGSVTNSESGAGFAVFMIDNGGRVAGWNESSTHLLGYQESEIIGHDMSEFFPDEETKDAISAFLSSGPENSMIEFDATCIRKGNVKFQSSVSMWKLIDESGGEHGTSAIMLDLSEHLLVEKQMNESEMQLRSLATRLQEVREEERTKIARELHDEFGQMLTALHMDLSLLQRMVSKIVTDPVGRISIFDKINSISELVEKTIRSARRIITELRPAVLDELGLLTAIQWQALEFENRTGIRCRIARLQHGISPSKDASTAVFRIFQEALTNVAKHAEASNVTVSLQIVGQSMVMEINDDGKGMAEEKKIEPTSTGFLGIRERVMAFNGRLEIRSKSGEGTTLMVSIPYPA